MSAAKAAVVYTASRRALDCGWCIHVAVLSFTHAVLYLAEQREVSDNCCEQAIAQATPIKIHPAS